MGIYNERYTKPQTQIPDANQYPEQDPYLQDPLASDLGAGIKIVDDLGAEIDTSSDGTSMELTDADRAKLAELQKKNDKISKELQDAQTKMSDISSGDAKSTPEERKTQLEEIKSTLDAIDAEIAQFNQGLELTNLDEAGYVSTIDKFEVDSLAEGLEDKISACTEQITVAQEAGAEKAKNKVEKELRDKFADKISDAQGFFNGSKDKHYFSGKVWNSNYIRDYYDGNSTKAQEVMAELVTAVRRGSKDGYGAFMSALDGIPASDADEVVTMIYSVLKNELKGGSSGDVEAGGSTESSRPSVPANETGDTPSDIPEAPVENPYEGVESMGVLDIIPSYVLDHMASILNKGNNSNRSADVKNKSRSVYYVEGGKDAHDNRRRNGLKFVGLTALDAARELKSLADKNKESNPFRESDGDVDADDDTLAYGE